MYIKEEGRISLLISEILKIVVVQVIKTVFVTNGSSAMLDSTASMNQTTTIIDTFNQYTDYISKYIW